jgi:hypothetical protein
VRVGFTGAGLDRADEARLDETRIAAAAAHGEARLLALAGLDPVVDEAGRLRWTGLEGAGHERLILLGFEGQAPRFAPLVEDAEIGGGAWHLFRLLHDMDPREAAIWGTARAQRMAWAASFLRSLRRGDPPVPRRLGAALHRLRAGAFPARRSGGDHAGAA